MFTAQVVIGAESLGEGIGRSKKEAEQKAAELAWKELTRRANAVLKNEPELEEEFDSDDPGETGDPAENA